MQVRVWNKDHRDHVEMFKGDQVTVPGRGFILLDLSEANQFLGQFTPIKKDGHGNHLKPKMLVIEKPVDGVLRALESVESICMLCGKDFGTKEALDVHSNKEHPAAKTTQAFRQKAN